MKKIKSQRLSRCERFLGNSECTSIFLQWNYIFYTLGVEALICTDAVNLVECVYIQKYRSTHNLGLMVNNRENRFGDLSSNASWGSLLFTIRECIYPALLISKVRVYSLFQLHYVI